MASVTVPELPGISVTLEGDYLPRPEQVADFKQAITQKVAGNWSEVGTGKSLVSYMYVAWHLLQGRKVVVAMPASLTTQYGLGFLDTFGDLTFSVALFTGNKKEREATIASFNGDWPQVLFCGFDQFVKYQSECHQNGYRVLVVDEAHCLCTMTNRMYIAVSGAVRRKGWYAYLMTATPHLSELAKAYGVISLTNPEAYIDFGHFESEHINYIEISYGAKVAPQIDSYRAVELLHKNLMANAVRRRQCEVLSLENPTIFNHKVQLAEKHVAAVNRVLEAWLVNMTPEKVEYLENPQKARQVALSAIANPEKFSDDIKPDWEDEPKNHLQLILDSIEGKLIVFCFFRDTITKLQSVFAKYNPAIIMGGRDNARESERFKNDPTCRIVFAQYGPGGAGHNWQGVSRSIVFYEPVADVQRLRQCIGRAHRSGQQHPVVVWFFIYNISIAKKLVAKAGQRAVLLQAALGDSTNYTDFITKE